MVPLFLGEGVVCGKGTALQGEKAEQGRQEGEERGSALQPGGPPLLRRGGALIFPGQTEKEESAPHLQRGTSPGEGEGVGFTGGTALQLGIQRFPFPECCLKGEQQREDGKQQKEDGTRYIPLPLQKGRTFGFDPYRPLSVPSYAAEDGKCRLESLKNKMQFQTYKNVEGLLFLSKYAKIL